MLILPKRKSTFNFYESFSDLVFCALVMFLVLVLFLAMNVNQKQEQVEGDLLAATETLTQIEADAEVAAKAAAEAELEAQQIRQQAEAAAALARLELDRNRALREEALALRDAELETIEAQRRAVIAEAQRLTRVERDRVEAERARVLDEQRAIERERQRIVAERERVEAQRVRIERELAQIDANREAAEAELVARQSALLAMEQRVDRQRRVYEEALGANRFAGLPGAPRLVVAYDWQPNRISVHPVPARLVEALNTTPAGLDGPALSDYYAQQRAAFVESIQGAEPLSARQYRALVRSVSVGLEPMASETRGSGVSLDLRWATSEEGLATTRVGVVIPGGQAARAGLRPGDELIGIDERAVTPGNLSSLLSGYEPGDAARLLVKRAGRPMAVQIEFDAVQVVELVEAYRTDLSLVASGALDTDYTYLWAPAQADALRAQLQAGKASDAIWQNTSRWAGRVSGPGRPVLRFSATADGGAVVIGGERLTVEQFRRVLSALAGGGVVVEYVGRRAAQDGEAGGVAEDLPEAIYEQALRPTGFVVRAPQLDQMLREAE